MVVTHIKKKPRVPQGRRHRFDAAVVSSRMVGKSLRGVKFGVQIFAAAIKHLKKQKIFV